jgi:hypothetical protein
VYRGIARRLAIRCLGFSSCVALLANAAASPGAAETPSESFFERCDDLHRLWERYEWNSTHSGQKMRADLALQVHCAHGRYAIGVLALERMLARGLIPVRSPTADLPQ